MILPKAESEATRWNMDEERRFLNGLGRWGDSPMTKAELLAGYLEGLRLRDPAKVGNLNLKACEHHAVALLNGEMLAHDATGTLARLA